MKRVHARTHARSHTPVWYAVPCVCGAFEWDRGRGRGSPKTVGVCSRLARGRESALLVFARILPAGILAWLVHMLIQLCGAAAHGTAAAADHTQRHNDLLDPIPITIFSTSTYVAVESGLFSSRASQLDTVHHVGETITQHIRLIFPSKTIFRISPMTTNISAAGVEF